MKSRLRCAAAALWLPLALAAIASPARAGAFADARGHLTFGYGYLGIPHAPGGSLAATGGFDLPIAERWRGGLDVGYYTFGSRTVEEGSLNATLDYSAFDLVAFGHWEPVRGPFARVSFGPGLTRARAAISAAAGGASFLDEALSDVLPTAALELTAMPRRVRPVRVALVLGARAAFRGGTDWTHYSARLGFHY